MTIKRLIVHLRKFVNGTDISTQWAKDAETILDEIDENIGMGELEDTFDDLQDKLSLYRPGGDEYLINEFEMKIFCERVISKIE